MRVGRKRKGGTLRRGREGQGEGWRVKELVNKGEEG